MIADIHRRTLALAAVLPALALAAPAAAQEGAAEPVTFTQCAVTTPGESLDCTNLFRLDAALAGVPEVHLTAHTADGRIQFVVVPASPSLAIVREVRILYDVGRPLIFEAMGDCLIEAAPAGGESMRCAALTPAGTLGLVVAGEGVLAPPAAAEAASPAPAAGEGAASFPDGIVSCRLTMLGADVECANVAVSRTTNGLAVSATTAGDGGLSIVTIATLEGLHRIDVVFFDDGPGDMAMLGAEDGVGGECRIEPLLDGHERLTCEIASQLGRLGVVIVGDGSNRF